MGFFFTVSSDRHLVVYTQKNHFSRVPTNIIYKFNMPIKCRRWCIILYNIYVKCIFHEQFLILTLKKVIKILLVLIMMTGITYQLSTYYSRWSFNVDGHRVLKVILAETYVIPSQGSRKMYIDFISWIIIYSWE